MIILRLFLTAVIVFFTTVTIVVVGEEFGSLAGIAFFGLLAFAAFMFLRFRFRRM